MPSQQDREAVEAVAMLKSYARLAVKLNLPDDHDGGGFTVKEVRLIASLLLGAMKDAATMGVLIDGDGEDPQQIWCLHCTGGLQEAEVAAYQHKPDCPIPRNQELIALMEKETP